MKVTLSLTVSAELQLTSERITIIDVDEIKHAPMNHIRLREREFVNKVLITHHKHSFLIFCHLMKTHVVLNGWRGVDDDAIC